jgi:hypothetical protein
MKDINRLKYALVAVIVAARSEDSPVERLSQTNRTHFGFRIDDVGNSLFLELTLQVTFDQKLLNNLPHIFVFDLGAISLEKQGGMTAELPHFADNLKNMSVLIIFFLKRPEIAFHALSNFFINSFLSRRKLRTNNMIVDFVHDQNLFALRIGRLLSSS